MDDIILLLTGTFKIMLLDLALCGDNIGVIALATKDMSQKYAKKASFIGIMGAILLRIIFACAITVILSIQWIPIKLIGGIFLVKITWDFIKSGEENESNKIKSSDRFWEAVFIIVLADVSMSLDNVLAIAGAADGNMIMIFLGVVINIPIIFYGSQFVTNLMKKHEIVVYLGGAVLAHTSINMILEDSITEKYLNIPIFINDIFPMLTALIVIVYGIIKIRNIKRNSEKKKYYI
jgi:integral membrane protein, YjbE family